MTTPRQYLIQQVPGRDTQPGRSESDQFNVINGLPSLPDELLILIFELATYEMHGHAEFDNRLAHAGKCRDAVALLARHLKSSSITSITLSQFGDTLDNLQRFLLVFKKLDHFTFHYWFHHGTWSRKHQAFDLTVMHALLSHHKLTLRSIKISYLTGALGSFDVTGFPLLEELSLSRWNTMVHWLSADPSNRDNVQCSESVANFDQADEDWLQGLTFAAIAPEIPLQSIRVDVNPDSGFFSPELNDVAAYPYGRINRVAAEVRSAGIIIEYPMPFISKQDFESAPPPRQSLAPTSTIQTDGGAMDEQ
ncbi:hypothetical protein QBC36DRAFT_309577 [Triangularia setosa]|uniref:Uncharacterized protein n=1 Tax=Triangularia setosa TaxID=2587417 RepID=A0AAN7A8I0_9PEZI|nr:hypothetical protein QBC36DRAFT_309577 [Podospora setosa]